MKTSTLRPGLLVSLKTSITGNVAYTKEIIDADHLIENGAKVAEWQTRRVIADPDEYENSRKARSKAAGLIRACCTQSAFGLLCPESAKDALDKATKRAREIAEEFNEGAALTQVYVYIIVGRIAPDDVEAVKAINSEVRELLEEMERGLRNFDVKLIRENASKAREIGAMLSPDSAARVQIAVEAARTAAKRIVQAGDTAAKELDTAAIRAITESRTAFLDLDGASDVKAPEAEQRAIDLTPAADVAPRRDPGSRVIEV